MLVIGATPVAMHAQFTFTTNNGALTITGYSGPGGAVLIPGITNGFPVTAIGSYAFAYKPTLTSVGLPDSVHTIGPGAFHLCTGLTNVAIGNGVTNIGESAFSSCDALPTVVIPDSLTSLGDIVFAQCTNLATVRLGNSVTSIWHFAFADCYSLTNLTLPSSLRSLTDNAFQRCANLRTVYFQGDAPGADASAFSGDTNAIVYYLPGTKGWGTTFDGLPAVPWDPRPQTTDGAFGVLTNQFGFNITGRSNLVVVVEASASLAGPIWQPVQTITLTGIPCYFSDPAWTNYPARFYRLRPP